MVRRGEVRGLRREGRVLGQVGWWRQKRRAGLGGRCPCRWSSQPPPRQRSAMPGAAWLLRLRAAPREGGRPPCVLQLPCRRSLGHGQRGRPPRGVGRLPRYGHGARLVGRHRDVLGYAPPPVGGRQRPRLPQAEGPEPLTGHASASVQASRQVRGTEMPTASQIAPRQAPKSSWPGPVDLEKARRGGTFSACGNRRRGRNEPIGIHPPASARAPRTRSAPAAGRRAAHLRGPPAGRPAPWLYNRFPLGSE